VSDHISRDCPTCGSPNTAEIIYGFVDVAGLTDGLESGRIVLGGCDLSQSSARWRCNACGGEWGDFATEMKEIERQRAEEQARHRAQALARGRMEASLDPDGWVLCPHCNYSFSSKARMSWDGERHVTCGTYLRLLPASD